jgi:hypothetical protein
MHIIYKQTNKNMSFFGFYDNDVVDYDEYYENKSQYEELDSFPVIYIEEHVDSSLKIDNKLFVYYSEKTGYYYITGKRTDTKKIISKPYSFLCKKSKDVNNFIVTMLGNNEFSLVLYNYTNMPMDDLNNATYDFMINNIDEKYELTAYDNQRFNNKDKCRIFTNALQICKHMNNYISDDEDEDGTEDNN